MGRLKAMPNRLAPMPSRVARPTYDGEGARSRMRRDTQSWRKWYSTKRWQRLRWSVLVRDAFTCRRCRRIESNTSQLVADHCEPHRGDAGLFWGADNLQCLCKACHDGAKQREERAAWR